ncbi:MAG: CHAT domain-containing protein [Acidobacteriota bacterium]
MALALACRPALVPDHDRQATMVDPAGHRYVLDVPAGHYVHGVVEPKAGFDLAVLVRGPDGDVVGGPIDLEGDDAAERFHLVTDVATRFTLDVRGFLGPGKDGTYDVRLVAFRPAAPDDRRRAQGHAGFLTARQLDSCDAKMGWLDQADRLYATLPPDPDDAFTHASILLDRGDCLSHELGDPHAAVEPLRAALELAGRSRDRAGIEPHVLGALGFAERRAGLPVEAEAHLQSAIEGFTHLGHDRDRLASMLTLATVYTDLGAWDDNLRLQRQVLTEARALGLHEQAAYGIANQGWTLMRQGQTREAEQLFEDAEALLPPGTAPALRAILSINRGFAALDLGHLDRADAFFASCLALTEVPTRHVMARLGRVYVAIARDDAEQARRLVEEAIDAAERHGRASLLASALDARARVLALDGSIDALRNALDDAERALGLIESTRPDERDDRAGYLDRHWTVVEMPIDAAVRLHELDPHPETVARAFDNAERVRFRTLVEELDSGRPAAEQLAGRASIDAIRDDLLDPDTALLQFHLGERGSFLFRLTIDALDVFRLPPREVIETRVAALRSAVTARTRLSSRRDILAADRTIPAIAEELSELLLDEALDGLDIDRLLIAADGDLHALPFAALPSPNTNRPLLLDREVVHIPSASVMTHLRARVAGRPAAARDLVIFADPVFGGSDTRLAASAAGGPAIRDTLPRLHYTAEEARAIAQIAGPTSRIHSGFEASHERILDGGLDGYRIVHFATHGQIGRTPAQTALVLSRVDVDGRTLDGDLTLAGLSDLELDAELVVLSACETAFGHELPGEGLLGLARGFMNAGVPRVVASLWKVDDRATRDLMVELYRRLLEDGARPAAALRAAQRTMHDRGEPVYHWAPFILQGEWL